MNEQQGVMVSKVNLREVRRAVSSDLSLVSHRNTKLGDGAVVRLSGGRRTMIMREDLLAFWRLNKVHVFRQGLEVLRLECVSTFLILFRNQTLV